MRNKIFGVIASGLVLLLVGLSTVKAQVSWQRQAYGQGPFYAPGHQGDPAYSYFYPNNNSWSQQLTFAYDNSNPPKPIYVSAPSNWSTDNYPNGGVDVTLGNGGLRANNAPTNLDRFVRTGNQGGVLSLNSLTIQPDGGLNIEAGVALMLNLLNLQGNNNNDANLTNNGGGGAFPVVFLTAGGTIKKTTGASTFTIDPNVGLRVNNGGTIACDAGALQLPSSGSTYAGGINFNAATGALIDLAPANAVDSNVVLFTGPMTGINTGGTVRLNKGWIRAGTGGSTLNFGGNTFQWQGGRLIGSAANPFTNLGTINITGSVTAVGDGIVNGRTIIQSGAGSLVVSPYPGSFTNAAGGVYEIRNDLGITGDFGAFNNAGTLRKSAGAGTSAIGDFEFDNSGTINAASGTLQFATLIQSDGSINLNGGNISSGRDITLNGGSLVGTGTIGGNVRNNGGNVAPGHSPGTITVTGGYTQGASGVLTMEIGGKTPGTEYDQLQVSGAAALGGTLNISLINGFRPAVGDVFQFISPGSVTGAFSTVNTTGFTGQVNYSAGAITMTVLTVPDIPVNIATRIRVNADPNQLIGGFIITGTEPKKVIIRAIGPSLSSFFSGVLADPTLELFQGNTMLASNNNWKDGGNQAAVEATGLAPKNDLESAIVRTLAPGAYTAIVRSNTGASGIGLIEAYDLDLAAKSQLANIATRGFVDTNDNVMIGGFIIGGNGQANGRVVIRAIGPSLSAFGIAGVLPDPLLELHDANGSTLLSNDDWKATQEAEITKTGLAPTDIRESAIVTSLRDGNYTAIVRGKNNATGVAVVEVYSVL